MARDEFDDRDRDRDRDRDDRNDAKRRVSAPAVTLIVLGVLGVLLESVSLVVAFTNPNAAVDFYQKSLVDAQPEGAAKEDLKRQFEKEKDGMRLDAPGNIVWGVVGLILSAVTAVGGFKMKGLSGYPLAMTGALAALLPVGGCCCLSTPVGIWALVVLLNPVVKAGFGLGRRSGPSDDLDPR